MKQPKQPTQRIVRVTLTGTMPLLLHADSIEWSDQMEAWKNEPANKKKSKPGDDRTPPFRWIGHLTFDHPSTGVVAIPSEYIMRCLMQGAAQVTLKGQKTFKEASQSSIFCLNEFWPLEVSGKLIQMKQIRAMEDLPTFQAHVEAVRKLGFDLFIKRAVIKGNKHIRVRPRFEAWSCSGDLAITDDAITDTVLESILGICGPQKGLGSWRPGGKTPGRFGTFTATIE